MDSSLENKGNKNFKEKKSNRKILFGAVMGYVYLALQIVSGIIFIPLISKHYGQNQYGLITLSNTFVNLLMTDIGISAIACRFLAQARAEDDQERIRMLTALLYKIYSILALIIFIVLFTMYFFVNNIFVGLTQNEMGTFKEIYIIMALCSVFVFALQGLDGILNAYEEYALVKIINISQRVLYIVFVAFALAFNWPIISIALITGLTNLICSSSKYFIVRFKLKLRPDFKNKASKEFAKSLSIYSLWQVMLSIFSRLNNYLSSPILGIVSDSKNIAVYGVALQLETYAFYISNVLGGLFVPKIARIFANSSSDEESSKKIFNLGVKIATIMSSISFLLIVGFISCGEEFVNLWMKDKAYSLSYVCAVILMLAQVLYAPNIIFKSAMQFKNNIKYLVFSSSTSLVIFVISAFILGYFYGAVGMCFAVAIAIIVKIIMEFVFYAIRLKINIWAYLKSCYLKQIPIIAIGLGIGLSIHYLVPLSDLYRLIIIIPAVAIPYLIYLWFVVFTKDLRHSLISIFKKS